MASPPARSAIACSSSRTPRDARVFLWFVGLSVALVWVVFQSPALDVRFVAAGSLVPLLDLLTGGAFVLHTLAASVVVLAAVIVATRRRRLVRRRWLGIPIGMFLHLVLDATWATPELFWWPFLGGDPFADPAPELDRPLGVVVAMEAAGLLALWWLWRTFGLADPDRRRLLLESGRLRP
jgi:hypothetical protein